MEVYMDDIVTTSVQEIDHVKNIKETSKILRH